MAKKKCNICGTDIGLLSQYKLKNGIICWECYDKIGKDFHAGGGRVLEKFSLTEIKKALAGEIELIPPKVYLSDQGTVIIDMSHEILYKLLPLFMTSDEVALETITGYRYIEDEKEYGVGHVVGAAAVGGMLFGGAGAVIGSVIGSNPKRKIKHIGVEITYDKDNVSELFCADIYKGKPIKASGFEYNGYLETAKSLMGQLDLLIKKHAAVSEEQKKIDIHAVSNADEIRKYKELLNEGIITQEEFAIKKNELLGISELAVHEKKSNHMEVPEDEEMERNYSIILKGTENKVMAIKAYRGLAEQNKGLKETKNLIDQVPVVIFEGLSKKQADHYIKTFLRTDSTARLECIQ